MTRWNVFLASMLLRPSTDRAMATRPELLLLSRTEYSRPSTASTYVVPRAALQTGDFFRDRLLAFSRGGMGDHFPGLFGNPFVLFLRPAKLAQFG